MNHRAGVGRHKRIAVAGMLALAGIAAMAAPTAASAKKTNVKVMTRNLYLGADLVPAVVAPNQAAAYDATGNIYESFEDTNFVSRAKQIVAEIKAKNPDLVGMQEVAKWRRGQRGHPDGAATPSKEVVVNYLGELKQQLRAAHLHYRPVMVQTEADIEFPVDGVHEPSDGTPDFDGRLTMRDVIFAKKGLKIAHSKGANYSPASTLSLPTAYLGNVTVKRGYGRVDVVKGRSERFRFVDTHLESFLASSRTAQAQELVAPGGPTDTRKPVIVVGDLNSDPDQDAADAAAYDAVRGAGFFDRGVRQFTCCFGSDLLDPDTSGFNQRIDHVLVSDKHVTAKHSSVIGIKQSERSDTGLWPSDHGGVVAKVKVPRR